MVSPSSPLQAPELAHSRHDASHKADDLLRQDGTVASWSEWDAPGCQAELQEINLQPAMAHLIIPLQVQDLLNFVTKTLCLFLQPKDPTQCRRRDTLQVGLFQLFPDIPLPAPLLQLLPCSLSCTAGFPGPSLQAVSIECVLFCHH